MAVLKQSEVRAGPSPAKRSAFFSFKGKEINGFA
jgi:hypothetical protein